MLERWMMLGTSVLVLGACARTDTEPIENAAPLAPDTVTVGRGHHEVTVRRTEDSVTVVMIAERGRGRTVVNATYDSGPTYRIWVSLRDITVTHIPWHTGGLRFGGSEAIQVDRGDVLAIRFPEDLQEAGLLSREGVIY